jgi:hypothetical protein
MAYKGKFKPQNPEKYKGDPSKIVYRSSWEARFFNFCDRHPDIIWWQSEEVIVPYRAPLPPLGDGEIHRYFPDIVLKKKVGENQFVIMMIEIKPKSQTKPPDISKKNKTPTGRVSRRYLNEVKTYSINDAKWEAAKKYCSERGWIFEIMTEDHLIGK